MKRVLLSLAVWSLLGISALADGNRYAVLALENTTDMTINYEFRWGSGEWDSCTLEPGERMTHTWRYDYVDENRSPYPFIRLDTDLSHDAEYDTFELDAYASPTREPEYGKTYRFGVSDSGDTLGICEVD